jgi:hypothetical protein
MNQYLLTTERMTAHRRPPAALRRVGHTLAALVQLAMVYVVNWWPGWRSVSFLTPDAARVVWLFNLAVVVGVALNLAYLVQDPAWLTALGDAVTAGFGLAVFVRTWLVFPFQFTDTTIDWALLVRVTLGLAIVGAAVGLFVRCISLLTEALR